MTPEDLAALHSRAMVHGTPWSAKSFASVLGDTRVFLLSDGLSSWQDHRGGRPKAAQPVGFTIGRVVADEAELLTLAVDPAAQGQGVGRRLLSRFEDTAAAAGAKTAFLEVSEANTPALGLYLSAGWAEAGRRARYYPGDGQSSFDALILRKPLGGLD